MPAETPTPILRKRLSQAEQTKDRCVHFTGLQYDTCKAGVAYKSVRLDHDPITYRRERGPVYTQSRSFPCLASHNLGGAVCEKRCAPTPEQVAAEEAESNSYIEQTMTALRLIHHATNGARGVAGTVVCPRCSGTIHYSVASSNGHVHARCATTGCLAWMQ